MKKFKKIITLLLVTVMATVLLTSCGKTKATPEESAKYFLDLVLKNDKSNMDKIGVTEKDYTDLRTELEDGLMKSFTNAGVSSDILTEEIKNKLKDDIMEGFSKLEYEVLSSSIDKKVAKIEINFKGFDMNKITEEAKVKVEDSYEESMTQQQLFQQSFKFIGEGFAKGTLVEQSKPVTIVLNKVGSVWVPSLDGINELTAVLVVTE